MHFNLYNGEPLGDVGENDLQEIKQNLKKLVEVEYVTWKEKAEIECFHKIDIFEEALIREGTWGYQFEESLERFQNTSWDMVGHAFSASSASVSTVLEYFLITETLKC